ncbi:pyridoxal-phosphate dependent enzyme [Sphingosinicella rhizophila]|uniref:Pyridoxal-phosphate dependent enzyme n=1 Tax=Sphingosinicella rhizophila TaxID=3050082 RepID=A0ABU3Q7T2_9SPHN|nr:pyridoxal-phosphate dependent enzyme [Sphingosinicella sp. GR2756]MDT9599382.1 pyridoxal-phosphate dependent enzyme [Sphingosinicella sp. GR2756]
MAENQYPPLTLDLIREAAARIEGRVNRTPVMTSETLDAMAGARLFFKCENLQKVGAFKARGAANAVFALTDEEARQGVATHSSGNHAAALARAAGLRGIPAYIVMPDNAPVAKQDNVRRYGGEIILCEPTLEARESNAARVVADTGATFIHPYDNLMVMAGQGTAAVELLTDCPDLDLILCAVGGGGLLSGTAVAAKSLKRDIEVVAVEPAGADDAFRSVKAGRILPSIKPNTIADGLLTSLSERTFAEIQRHVDDIVTVSDTAIIAAMRRMWEVLKIVVEPSGAVAYSATSGTGLDLKDRRVGIMITGGNLDLDWLPWMSPKAQA